MNLGLHYLWIRLRESARVFFVTFFSVKTSQTIVFDFRLYFRIKSQCLFDSQNVTKSPKCTCKNIFKNLCTQEFCNCLEILLEFEFVTCDGRAKFQTWAIYGSSFLKTSAATTER